MASNPRHRALLLALFAAGLTALAAGCSGKDPYDPGTKLGTFHVTAKLTATTCGQPPNPWEFDVKLNHDGPTLFWIQGAYTPAIVGRVDLTGATKLTTSVVVDLRPADARRKVAACTMERSDALALTLSTAAQRPAYDPADASGFSGVLSYAFAPTPGSDCTDQVVSAGGGYDALPCSVSYDITGVLTVPPPSITSATARGDAGTPDVP